MCAPRHRRDSNGITHAHARPLTEGVADLQELLILELQEIHSAENQLSRTIPWIAKATQAEKLQAALEQRLAEGERIVADVEAGLDELGASPGGKRNVAAEGLVNGLREHMQEIEQGPALDAVVISSLQKTEHYCNAAWGTTKAQAEALGQKELVRAMKRALKEGGSYDEKLTQLAERAVAPALIAMREGAERAPA